MDPQEEELDKIDMDRYLVIVEQLRHTIDELEETRCMLHQEQTKNKKLEEFLSRIGALVASSKETNDQPNQPREDLGKD
jgi:predicted RNA-binding Zn ribbon-like protein